MTLIRRSSPWGDLLSLRQTMDRLFEDSFMRPRAAESAAAGIPLDVLMTPDALVVEAALPGVKPENVAISVLGDTLTISAQSTSEERREQGGYLYQEVRRGSFSRAVTLPSNVRPDAASATFENGMLRLSIPKAEEAKPREIRISPLTQGLADGAAEVSTETPAAAESTDGAAGGETTQAA
jgi:HSP20 family protein